MDRESLVLAALAPANGASHTPVQLQKLLFLIDRSVNDKVGGPHFDFEPYDYGPFDKDVYSTIEQLALKGLVKTEDSGRGWKKFALTSEGQNLAESQLETLDANTRDYFGKLSRFVLSLSFTQLVSAIYKSFPEMKVNSVFKG